MVEGLSTKPTCGSDDLAYKESLGTRKPRTRWLYGLGGWGPLRSWRVHNADIKTLARGLLERVILQKNEDVWTKPIRPAHGHLFRELMPFWMQVRGRFTSLTPIALDDFPSLYTGQKKANYERARESLNVRALNRDDSRIKVFVKAEKLDITSKPDPAPRVIQPRDIRFNLVFGTFIRPLEHVAYGVFNQLFGGRSIAKGTTVEDVGQMMYDKWSVFQHPCFIGLDASRFSQCVSKEARLFVQQIYKRAYPSDKTLRWCCSQTLANRGTARTWDGFLSYFVDGTLSDGDMDTSLVGNTLSSAMLYCWMRRVGIKCYRVIINGDDCGVFIDRSDIRRFTTGLAEWYLSLGFKMKVEKPVFELEHVEFCQSHPIFDGERWIMVRRFPNAISKQCRSLVALKTPEDFDLYWSCVGEGGLSITGGIPCFQDFFRSLIRKKASKFFQGAIEGVWSPHLLLDRVYREPLPMARYSFWRAFGYTPDEQIAIESYYRRSLYEYNVPTPVDSVTSRPYSLI